MCAQDEYGARETQWNLATACAREKRSHLCVFDVQRAMQPFRIAVNGRRAVAVQCSQWHPGMRGDAYARERKREVLGSQLRTWVSEEERR